MANYHASMKVLKRSAGRSATAAASYRAAEKITDHRTGEIFDYTRKSSVDHKIILLPDHAPERMRDRSTLWNEVEQTEKRKDAQVAREFEVSLPVELEFDQQVLLVEKFVKKEFVDLGMIADICVHDSKSHNPHAHIMLTMRDVDLDGFGKKNRSWNAKENINIWRKAWETHTNKSLEINGFDERIDHRSLEDQGIDREPQIHHANKPIRIDKNNEIKERNFEKIMKRIMRLKAKLSLLAFKIKQLTGKISERTGAKNEREAVEKNSRSAGRGIENCGGYVDHFNRQCRIAYINFRAKRFGRTRFNVEESDIRNHQQESFRAAKSHGSTL